MLALCYLLTAEYAYLEQLSEFNGKGGHGWDWREHARGA